jgi:hypothetical protein
MLRVSDGVLIAFAVSQPTEGQRIGNQIDAAMIFARTNGPRRNVSPVICHFIAPYSLSMLVVLSIGRASTVCPCPVVVVARNIEL